MTTSGYKALYVAIQGLIFFLIVTLQLNASTGYAYLAIAVTIELVLFVYTNWKVTGEVFNFTVIFVVLLYLFHFGQVILMGFFPGTTKNQQITLKYFRTTDCLDAMRIITIIFLFVCLGIIVAGRKKIDAIKSDFTENIDYDHLKSKAITMITITFPVKVIIDGIFFVKAISLGEGFGVYWLNGIPQFLRTYGDFSVIGFCLLISSLCNKTGKQTRALVLILTYFLALMLSGRRSENVVYVCIFVFIYLKTNKRKINLWKVIALSFFAYMFITFLYAIVYNRSQVGIQTISSFADAFVLVLKEKNIFVETLREYGNTGYTAVCVVAFWLKNKAPTYGLSLLCGCTAIFPNITGLPGELTELGNFAIQLKNYGMVTRLYTNIGGSLIGELLFNFGVVGGAVAAFILGLLIGKLGRRVQELMAVSDYIKLSYYIPAMISVLYWVRDVLGGEIRTMVWGILFVSVAKKFVVRWKP